jgi:hypothetical protein
MHNAYDSQEKEGKEAHGNLRKQHNNKTRK